MVDVEIDPDVVADHIARLAAHGAHGDTGVWRPAYSDAWVAAQEEVSGWFSDAGLTVRRDPLGTVSGRLEGTEDAPTLVTGSHIDSETPGGQFDGALGVIAGLVAVRALREQFGTPRRPIEALSLCEEEGNRFREANFLGSRALTGAIDAEDLHALIDEDGISAADAMKRVGLDPERVGEARRTDIGVFIELHIEQGPRLEDANLPVGVVTAITGFREYVIELNGRADHAGARPMIGRRDALLGASEIAVAAISRALELGPPAVTTVTRMNVEPNTSSVPSRVMMTLDIRHPDPAVLTELQDHALALIQRVGEERDLEVSLQPAFDLEPVPCDAQVIAALCKSADAAGIPYMQMHSGAVHDTQRMAGVSSVGMVFVRSKGGVSHSPEEYTSVEDAVAGIRVLAGAIHELAYARTEVLDETRAVHRD